jgi:hypothetical protein
MAPPAFIKIIYIAQIYPGIFQMLVLPTLSTWLIISKKKQYAQYKELSLFGTIFKVDYLA